MTKYKVKEPQLNFAGIINEVVKAHNSDSELREEFGYLGRYRARERVFAVIEVMTETLQAGESIKMKGFGFFIIREIKGRTVVDLWRNTLMEYETRKTVVFKPGKTLKREVNKGG